MSAAILQGVPAVTFDTDIWIDLPEKQFDRVLVLCHELGATIPSDTLAVLADGTELNFLYQVTGLGSFAREYKKAKKINWLGEKVAVLSLKQIHQSKKAVGRPKDKVHLFYLEQAMKLQKKLKLRRRA